MFGLNLEFECKSCKEKQRKTIGGTGVYKINDKDYDFVPVVCRKCNKLHYIATKETIIDEDTEEARLKEFERVNSLYPRSNPEELRNIYLKSNAFITKDEGILINKL